MIRSIVLSGLAVSLMLGTTGCSNPNIGPTSSKAAVESMLTAADQDDLESGRMIVDAKELGITDQEIKYELKDIRNFLAEAGGLAKIEVSEKERLGASLLMVAKGEKTGAAREISLTVEVRGGRERYYVGLNTLPLNEEDKVVSSPEPIALPGAGSSGLTDQNTL